MELEQLQPHWNWVNDIKQTHQYNIFIFKVAENLFFSIVKNSNTRLARERTVAKPGIHAKDV